MRQDAHTLRLQNEIMDGEEITIVMLAYYWVERKIEQAGESIAIVSQISSGHRRWINQTIGDIITSNINPRFLHDNFGNIADVPATFLVFLVNRRYITD